MKKYIQLLSLCLLGTTAGAQIQFQLDYLPAEDRYLVSAYAEKDYSNSPMVGTAQITLTAAAKSLVITDFENEIPGVIFSFNSAAESPVEAPGQDYFSVGLTTMGTELIPFVKDEPVALFSFANMHECSTPVSLLDHATDPLFLHPEKTVNVGNQITLLADMADVYAGNRDTGIAHCDGTVGTREATLGWTDIRTFPNPVQRAVQVRLEAEQPRTATLELTDTQGRTLRSQAVAIQSGINEWSFDLQALPAAAYRLVLRTEEGPVDIGQVVKVD